MCGRAEPGLGGSGWLVRRRCSFGISVRMRRCGCEGFRSQWATATRAGQSVSDRTSIQDAAADVANCGPDLTTDVQVFTNAADSRTTLIGGLSSLPGRSALPAPMLQDLTYAWTASQEADRDLAGWASDESNQGCTDNDTTDPDFQAATQPDDQATTYKTEFVGLWNPIATQFGQPTYSWQNL
jgi:hypothetical protein